MASLESARDGAENVERAAENVTEHPVFENIARGGFVMSGLVHVLIGVIALRMALGDSSADADQGGALRAVASAPGGVILLWIGGLAMAALVIWHVAEAWFGARWKDDGTETIVHVVRTLGKAVVYGALAVTALRFAAGGSSDSGQQTSEVTAGLLGGAAGRIAVVMVGLVVLGIGCYHVHKGASRGFEDDLRIPRGQQIARAIVVTGVLGYVAKGIALLGVGLMFGWAGLGADPEKATGLDGALQSTASLPAGGIALAVIGAGLVLYGIYAALRSRYAPM
ncbi:hypothetical protein CFK41_01545 [Brachybacterium ginsengisoli]|uniref:DUF1206 domain-containing protein n=1 Tax=Brachybacterium ginsengisoli TaxID=1331682 RepID=A0A291GU19_9MICO|nr:DUF1206 domain-containing protein [Brachybacterium ginsengisoli]ATG53606.1 hypothetical protein CFK41_01545 [Brachybacterium ginsengisoli]